MTLCFLTVGCFGKGDHTRARRLSEQALALVREVGDPLATSIACHAEAKVAQAEGDHERAKGLLQEGLKLSAESGDQTNVAYCLEGLAATASSEGRLARAARLWGSAPGEDRSRSLHLRAGPLRLPG